MNWLPALLSPGTSMLGIADQFYDDSWGGPNSYRRMGKITAIIALSFDQLNTLYTCFGVNFPALKWIESTVLIAEIAILLVEVRSGHRQADQVPRILLGALNTARLT